ncbi:MAG: sugar transferase [Lachnospiraceae bacterium]|nr:sugar transferase [Lachnospiraceae bacterium]
MYQRKSNLLNIVIMILDCICITVSLILANYFRNGKAFVSDNERMDFGLMLGGCLVAFLAWNMFKNIYKDMFLRGPFSELIQIVGNNIIIFSGSAMLLYFMKRLDAYSRLVFVYFIVLDCVLMFVLHLVWKRMLPSLYWRMGLAGKVLLIADKENAPKLVKNIRNTGDFGVDLVGIALTDDSYEGNVNGTKVVTKAKDLIEFCQGASLDEVYIAVREAQDTKLLEVMNTLSEMGIIVHYQMPVPELTGAKQKVLSQLGGSYNVTYASRMVPGGQLLVKRAMDICGALVGCLILAVVTVVFGPLIKLESPGPVFFAQKRVGKNGRIFKMYKFRSMYADAEERKKELMAQNEMSGFMFKMENDPRITKIGGFMRKTSLDEFPQFINILKGDMSLVGTRPPTLDEFAQYSPYHKKRLSFRPGLTGMWQVSGRSDITDFEEIVRLDVEYIEDWSVGLDIKILLKTVLAVFKGSGAK